MTLAIGRSVRLFLVDGKPTGLITAEIMNWTGHVLTGPRAELPKFLARSEVGRTGVYFLHGPAPDNPDQPVLYIGESDQVGTRLKQHNQEDKRPTGSGPVSSPARTRTSPRRTPAIWSRA